LERLCLKPGTFEKYKKQIEAMDEPKKLVTLLYQDADAFYAEREKLLTDLGIDMREFERVVLLNAIDRHWMDHIDAMDDLRDGIGLRAYGQRDPVQEYRAESFDMFNDMVHMIREDTVRRLFQSRVERLPERRKTVDVSKTQEGFAGGGAPRPAPAGQRPAPTGQRPPSGAQRPVADGQVKKSAAPTSMSQPGAVGRNQPCPCGSGKKYKHCCGKNAG
jgi:preprotein translocase subunit SecA